MNIKGILIALLMISSPVYAAPQIEVFLGQEQQLKNVKSVKGYSVKVFDLTLASKIEDRISINLSDDPAIAQRQAMKLLQKNGKNIMHEFAIAHKGTIKANGYKITKLPAITFEQGKYVVYGVNDVMKALKIYRKARQE